MFLRAAKLMLIAGAGACQAMKELGWKNADCFLFDSDQRTADQMLLADNRIGELSHFDPEKRAELLEDIEADLYGSVGFTADEVAEYVDSLGGDDLEILDMDTSEVKDTFVLTVTGPLAQQAWALKRARELMAELPGVNVDLSTAG